MNGKIQNLLEQANYSETNDTSISQAERDFQSEPEAETFFSRTKEKLLHLENWNESSTPSNYRLYDESGAVSSPQIIEVGKFIRIKVAASGKPDWVRVIDLYEAPDEFVITVKPTYDPTAGEPDATETSHFFKSEATNNFSLQRHKKSVTLYVIGLDEKANVKEAGNPLEAVRNVATANLGYYLGAQKAMWTEFCARFLEIEKE